MKDVSSPMNKPKGPTAGSPRSWSRSNIRPCTDPPRRAVAVTRDARRPRSRVSSRSHARVAETLATRIRSRPRTGPHELSRARGSVGLATIAPLATAVSSARRRGACHSS